MKKFLKSLVYTLRDVGACWTETPAERDAKDALRNKIRALLERHKDATHTENAWVAHIRRMSGLILRHNPKNFLRWDVVGEAMFHQPHADELRYLQNHDWTFWQPVLRESCVGNPASNGNLIHQAYSLAQLLAHRPLKSIRRIIEFGGGYGGMCRLLYALGYQGEYVIFDLPEFSSLQQYYLEQTGVLKEHAQRIRFLNSLDDLAALPASPEYSVFLGLWSISETPLELRREVFSRVHPDDFLIAYQARFQKINNMDYFADLRGALKTVWLDEEIAHLKGNRYLVGTTRA